MALTVVKYNRKSVGATSSTTGTPGILMKSKVQSQSAIKHQAATSSSTPAAADNKVCRNLFVIHLFVISSFLLSVFHFDILVFVKNRLFTTLVIVGYCKTGMLCYAWDANIWQNCILQDAKIWAKMHFIGDIGD